MSRTACWAMLAPAALGWASADTAVAAIPAQMPDAAPPGAGELRADAGSAYAKGRDLLAKGDPVKALQWFRIALRDDPGSVDALNAMGVALDRVGRYDLARPYYETALALSPEAPDLLHNYGLSLFLQGRHAAAIPILRRAMAQADDAVRASSLAVLKRIEGQNRRLDETMLASSAGAARTSAAQDASAGADRLVRIAKGEMQLASGAVQLAAGAVPTAAPAPPAAEAGRPSPQALAEAPSVTEGRAPQLATVPVPAERPLARNAQGEVLVASLGKMPPPAADLPARALPKAQPNSRDAMAAATPASPLVPVEQTLEGHSAAPQLVRIGDGELWLATRRDPGDPDAEAQVPTWTEQDELALVAQEQAAEQARELAARQSVTLPSETPEVATAMVVWEPAPGPIEDQRDPVQPPLWLPPKLANGEVLAARPAHFLPLQLRRQVAMAPVAPVDRTPLPAPIPDRFARAFISDNPRLNAFADRMQRRGRDALGRSRRPDAQTQDVLPMGSEVAASSALAPLPLRLRFRSAFQSDRDQLNSFAEALVGAARALPAPHIRQS